MMRSSRVRSLALGSALAILAAGCVAVPATAATAPPATGVVINEITYDKAVTGSGDAIELINTGLTEVDLSGWRVSDDKGLTADAEPYTVPAGTVLAPGGFLGLEGEDVDFTFGLGKGDAVNVYDASGALVDAHAYEATSVSSNWSRIPDGTGEWVAGAATTGAPNVAYEPPAPPTATGLRINEVDSQPADWVEFHNPGDGVLDVSGFEIRDDSDDHRWRFPTGTTVAAGGFLVVEESSVGQVWDDQASAYVTGTFTGAIGIGGADKIRLYDAAGTLIDETYTWSQHAAVGTDTAGYTLAREVDGIGGFLLSAISKGASNAGTAVAPGVAVNEINSNGGPNDYVEVINTSPAAIDLTGWHIHDSDVRGPADVTPLPAGTTLAPGARFVFEENTHFTFGLGNGDAARVLTGAGTLVDEHAYPAHPAAGGVWAACPEGGDTFVEASRTPGAANVCEGGGEEPAEPGTEYDPLPWPGGSEVRTLDTTAAFLEDSSGLDTWTDATGTYLYAVDNGTGTFWKLRVQADGSFAFADGWADGKRVRFQKDAGNPAAAGPDAEGITAAGDGYVYIASERDNSRKDVNHDVILKVDPNVPGRDLVALAEWDVTSLIPTVGANLGIEAVEWVADADLAGKLWDTTRNKPYAPADYPGHGDGLFFAAVEDGGSVHAFALSDGGVAEVAEFIPGLSGVMSLDWDTVRGGLWTVCDDGCGNVAAFVTFDGSAEPDVVFHARPAGAPVDNAEGFATAPAALAADGMRPVWWFTDGVQPGALRAGTLPADAGEEPGGEEPGGEEPGGEPGGAPGGQPGLPQTGGPAPAPSEDDLNAGNQQGLAIRGSATLAAGGLVTVVLDAVHAGETVHGWLFSEPTSLGAAVVAADGSVVFRIPSDMPAGAHRLVVTDADGAVLGWVDVTVAADASLVATGAQLPLGSALGAAALLVAAGVLLAVRPRRRTA